MTASVLFEGVAKSFGSVEALKPLDLRIDQGEFVVLVGPSGSGKTTTLRLLAGLEQVSQGKIWISERLVNDVPAAERDVAMVFQTYALYPHMTVRRNLEYGLKRRRLDRAIINTRIREAVSLLRIEEFLDRYPSQLSGGQAQTRRSMPRPLSGILRCYSWTNLYRASTPSYARMRGLRSRGCRRRRAQPRSTSHTTRSRP